MYGNTNAIDMKLIEYFSSPLGGKSQLSGSRTSLLRLDSTGQTVSDDKSQDRGRDVERNLGKQTPSLLNQFVRNCENRIVQKTQINSSVYVFEKPVETSRMVNLMERPKPGPTVSLSGAVAAMTLTERKKKTRPSCKKRRRYQLQKHQTDYREKMAAINRKNTADSCGQQKTISTTSKTSYQQPDLDSCSASNARTKTTSESSDNSDIIFGICDDNKEASTSSICSSNDTSACDHKASPQSPTKISASKCVLFISAGDLSDSDNESYDGFSDTESSPQNSDFDDEMWNSMCSQGNPLNVLQVCTISPPAVFNQVPEAAAYSAVELAANERWNAVYDNDSYQSTPSRVAFPSDPVTGIHLCPTQTEEPRGGIWEQFARDRCRFKNRIKNVGLDIQWCLEREHRSKVYNKLYGDIPSIHPQWSIL